MKLIPLTKGYFTKVDDDDYERLASAKWYALVEKNGHVRALRGVWINKKTILIVLSRVVIGAPKGKCVDHINGDTLDNRKCNLRICTKAENQRNTRLYKNNTSGYKGVLRNGPYWRANIRVNKKAYNLGSYKTKEEAALAYNEGAKKFYGEFARPNIIVN